MRDNLGRFVKGQPSIFKGKKHSAESIEKNRIKHLGKKASEKTRAKMRKSSSKFWLGKKRPGAYEWLMAGLIKSGKKSNWKGGITFSPSYKRIVNAKRRTLKNKAGGNFTIIEWENLKKLYKYTCLCCKTEEPKIKLTVDHIIPVSRGGDSFIANIQPLCFSCNKKNIQKQLIIEFKGGVVKLRTFNYITVGRILHELEEEGLKLSRVTFLRLETRLNLPKGKRTSGLLKWRVYTPEQLKEIKERIKSEFNFVKA